MSQDEKMRSDGPNGLEARDVQKPSKSNLVMSKVAAAAMSGAMVLGQAMPAQAGPTFTPQISAANPLDFVDVGNKARPVLVDVDGDGNIDAFVGGDYAGSGYVNYYYNYDGTFYSGYTSPISTYANYPAPAFVDIDGDGDYDAFIGTNTGDIEFHRDDGGGVLTEITVTGRPFDGVNVGGYAAPAFVDIDNDGDFDAFVGTEAGQIAHFKNQGDKYTPNFQVQSGPANPLGAASLPDAKPAFVDIDFDGDYDVFIGNKMMGIAFAKNEGTPSAPVFVPQVAANNPLEGILIADAAPTFADIDGDGDYDLFVGDYYGNVSFFSNDGFPSPPGDSQTVMAPPGSTAADFRIVSCGVQPSLSTMNEVIQSIVGTYDPTQMRIGSWDPAASNYDEYPALDSSSHPGWAGWFLFRSGAALNFSGTQTMPDASCFGVPCYGIPIQSGWNMVGNPFDFPIAVAGIVVEDGGGKTLLLDPGNTTTQQIFWVFSNGGYNPAGVLEPGQGGWVKMLTSGPGTIYFPAVAGSALVEAASLLVTREDVERPPAPPVALNTGGTSEAGGGGGGGCFAGATEE